MIRLCNLIFVVVVASSLFPFLFYFSPYIYRVCLLNSLHFRKDYKIAPRNDIFDGICPVTACVAQVYRSSICFVTCEWNVFFLWIGCECEYVCLSEREKESLPARVRISVRDIIICGIEQKPLTVHRLSERLWER